MSRALSLMHRQYGVKTAHDLCGECKNLINVNCSPDHEFCARFPVWTCAVARTDRRVVRGSGGIKRLEDARGIVLLHDTMKTLVSHFQALRSTIRELSDRLSGYEDDCLDEDLDDDPDDYDDEDGFVLAGLPEDGAFLDDEDD